MNIGAFSQALNVTHLANMDYDDLPFGQKLNDIWGYASPSGREYALVGLRNGISVVRINDDNSLTEVKRFPGPMSVWRDIKTFGHYAYITHDNWNGGNPEGLVILDLSQVDNNVVTKTNYTQGGQLHRAHNIYIDENGVAYLTGANIGIGGALMLDVTGGANVQMLGNYNDYYLHDCVTRGDTMFGGAINDGLLVAVDVSDKSNPVELGNITTPNSFTHNCWFSDDNHYVFTTDETSGSYVTSYDVSDPANMVELDRIQSFYSDSTIPHNVHYINNFLVNSYYRDGLQILDVTHPDNMIDVGHYDTSPDFEGNGFNGAWGTYPYFPSGKAIVSDMETGLHLFEVDYKQAGYLHIHVTDSLSGNDLSGAQVLFNNTMEAANLQGKLKTGHAISGTYSVKVISPGYTDKTVSVTLTNGQITQADIKMLPIGFSVEENEKLNNIAVLTHKKELRILSKELTLEQLTIFDGAGRKVFAKNHLDTENITWQAPKTGVYFVLMQTENFSRVARVSIR